MPAAAQPIFDRQSLTPAAISAGMGEFLCPKR
jgi:hypothetical protein